MFRGSDAAWHALLTSGAAAAVQTNHTSTAPPQPPVFRLTGDYDYGRLGNHVQSLFHAVQMAVCCRGVLDVPANAHFPLMKRRLDFRNATVPYAEREQDEVCRHGLSARDRVFFAAANPRDATNSTLHYLPPCAFNLSSLLQLVLLDIRDNAECPSVRTQLGCGAESRPSSLTVHIRSGDIFGSWGRLNFSTTLFQPPVYFYQQVLSSQRWGLVTFVTSPEEEPKFLNPVWKWFKARFAANTTAFRFRQSESVEADFRLLLCSRNLVPARSSFSRATLLLSPFVHSIFVPDTPAGCLAAGNTTDTHRKDINCTIVPVPGFADQIHQPWRNTKEQLAYLVFHSNTSA